MAGRSALRGQTPEAPRAGAGQVLIKVSACGVCRTDLHLADGELLACRYPITPGHEVVGTPTFPPANVAACRGWGGPAANATTAGAPGEPLRACALHRLPYRWRLCGIRGRDERFCLPIPERYGDAEAAPLLCAGLMATARYASANTPRPSASMASARRRTSWRKWRAPMDIRSSLSQGEGPRRTELRAGLRCALGGRLERSAAGAARRGHCLRPGRRARGGGAESR